MTRSVEILAQLPGVLNQLERADSRLAAIRAGNIPIPQVVECSQQPLGAIDWDVVISGGTLGILIGCALVLRGWRVAVIEQGLLRGRDQEWNISAKELEVFEQMDLLSAAQLQQAIATQFNPVRISFFEGSELFVKDVLNIGVDPVFLLDTLKQRFLAAGGCLFENTLFERAVVHRNGILVIAAGNEFKTRLLLDAMGHFSPIARQARQGQKPDGICLVVGTCAQGFSQNDTGDLLVSCTPIQHQCQYFWEAFPARDGRTTYLFTYMDADPQHLGLADLFAEYFRLLPEYQRIELAQLQIQRALFGFFPSYRHSPLQFPWNRILPIGDSSGNQSPLSFGGFGAMLRHLLRLTEGIHEALVTDQLSKQALALLMPYQPSLSVTWLFQKAMSVGIEQKIPPNQINQLLSVVFQQMQELGEPVLKPFLQDVVQFSGLTRTLLKTALAHPAIVIQVMRQVGWISLLDWMRHYANLGAYSTMYQVGQVLAPGIDKLPPVPQYYYHRWLEAWQYGSGGDY